MVFRVEAPIIDHLCYMLGLEKNKVVQKNFFYRKIEIMRSTILSVILFLKLQYFEFLKPKVG